MIHPHPFFFKYLPKFIKTMEQRQKKLTIAYNLLLILAALVYTGEAIKFNYKLDKHQLFCFH